MDQGAGLVLDQQKAHGLGEDTLVLFMSDNGPPFIKVQADTLRRWCEPALDHSVSRCNTWHLESKSNILRWRCTHHPVLM